MKDGQYGVVVRHSWTGVAHDLPDLLAAVFLEAVNRTVEASGLIGVEGTLLDPPIYIVPERPTLVAQVIARLVMTMTIDANHRLDCLQLTLNAT